MSWADYDFAQKKHTQDIKIYTTVIVKIGPHVHSNSGGGGGISNLARR
jgi:hypothetical protein